MNDIQKELNRRNTDAAFVSIRAMEKKIFAQDEKINQLQATLGQYMQKLQQMETALNILKSQRTGNGPTARGYGGLD